MKKISIKLLANVLLIITATVAGTPLAGHAAPEVTAWGYNDSGQTDVPNGLSNVVAIAAGDYHCLALTTEGRVVAWGNHDSGQTTVPNGLSNVVEIAAGYAHSFGADGRGPGGSVARPDGCAQRIEQRSGDRGVSES